MVGVLPMHIDTQSGMLKEVGISYVNMTCCLLITDSKDVLLNFILLCSKAIYFMVFYALFLTVY